MRPTPTPPPLDPEVWEAIPPISIDLNAVQRRGRQLRRRRRAVATGATTLATAGIAALAWSVATAPIEPPVEPASGGVSNEPATPRDEPVTPQKLAPTAESPPTEEPSPDDIPPEPSEPEAQDTEGVLAPRMQPEELEALAVSAGLQVNSTIAVSNMLDAVLTHPSDVTISITITTAEEESVSGAIQHAIAEKPYSEQQIGGHQVFYRPAASPGEFAHWLLTSTDGTQMIAVRATPPGALAGGNEIPDSVLNLVESELIPTLGDT